MQYEIYADEAWTHQTPPLKRYWCFHGGFFGASPEIDSALTALKKAQAAANSSGIEVKWTKLSALNESHYYDLLDIIFARLTSGRLKYRQIFLDRQFQRVATQGEPPSSAIDVQFKVYYQFLKHMFGLQYAPPGATRVLIRLDTHSSQQHKEQLTRFAQDLPRLWQRPELEVKVSFHRSRDHLLIQMADLLMGAAGSHGNQQHLLRHKPRGMTPRQKLRHRFAKHIYNCLRALDAAQRGTKAFNWFESTSTGGRLQNAFDYPLSIWKFKPMTFQIDRGWQRDHLDKFGCYQGPDIDPVVRSAKD